jgi:hypothetical protein
MEIGKYISADLTKFLSKHTTLKDAVDIEAETNVGASIILKVKNGTAKVTDSNVKAIIKLFETACKNIESSQEEAKLIKKELKNFLTVQN